VALRATPLFVELVAPVDESDGAFAELGRLGVVAAVDDDGEPATSPEAGDGGVADLEAEVGEEAGLGVAGGDVGEVVLDVKHSLPAELL